MELGVGILIGLAVGLVLGYYVAQKTSHPADRSNNEIAGLLARIETSALDKNTLTKQLADLQSQLLEVSSSKAKLEAENAQYLKNETTMRAEFTALQETAQLKFQTLANEVMSLNTAKLQQFGNDTLSRLVSPLREQIQTFQTKLEETYQKELKERTEINVELKRVAELNNKLSTEAHNLTTALRGDRQKQGTWGELVLKRILEHSGLREGREYVEQGKGLGMTDDNDSRLKPDFVIMLPDNKHIVVDSKVTLTSLLDYSSAGERDRQGHLDRFLVSIRSHVAGLASKQYHANQAVISPEFVVLFIPTESAFSLLLTTIPEIVDEALDQKVLIVGPINLYSCLRTIASVWKVEHQSRNTQEIVELGGKLYDKFVGFVTSMVTVGTSLAAAQDSYAEALKKLSSGRGNLVSQAKKLKALNVKVSPIRNRTVAQMLDGNNDFDEPSDEAPAEIAAHDDGGEGAA